MNRTAGFTLMEVLAALVLFGLLLAGVFSALLTVTHSTHAGVALTQRIDEVRTAQNYLRRTLPQATAYPWSAGRDARGTLFVGDAQRMTFVAPAPGILKSKGLQLQELRLVPDGTSFRLEVAFASLATRHGAQVVPAEPQVLITGIREGKFSYFGDDDDNGDHHAWSSRWDYPYKLPDMVGIKLVLVDGRSWPEVQLALRMDPAAINVREGLYRLGSTQGAH